MKVYCYTFEELCELYPDPERTYRNLVDFSHIISVDIGLPTNIGRYNAFLGLEVPVRQSPYPGYYEIEGLGTKGYYPICATFNYNIGIFEEL